MSLVLHVDTARWHAHQAAVLANRPGLVPVLKGNGYGFGLTRLAERATALGVATVAVGTPSEVAPVAQVFAGDLVVLTPWRAFDAVTTDTATAARLIHTIGRAEDLAALLATDPQARIVLELRTSMKRHGFTPRGLREAAASARAAGARIEGASLHLPLGPSGGNGPEAERLMTELVSAGLLTADPGASAPAVWVSHLTAAEVAALAARYPEVTFRQRIGTELWLGDRGALRVTAHVLDSHPVERGEEFGYRGRTLPRSGTLLVVSGGTAHGIGLEAPTGESSARARVSTLARGGLDAVGLAKSPYTVDGKSRYFAEPPHMQASMLFLPAGASVPAIGDEVDVRVRFTATTVDQVRFD